MIPACIADEIEQSTGLRPVHSQMLGGGSINQAARAATSEGAVVVKWNKASLHRMFETEATGLRLLSDAGTDLVIPNVFHHGRSDKQDYSWIVMEYIPGGRGGRQADRSFGSGLAALHRNVFSRYGLDHDNFIGRLPQSNTFCDSWVPFFMEERIAPQLRQAVDAGLLPSSCISSLDALRRRAEELFPDEPASLLHGDLWSGNYLYTSQGGVSIIDPAVYYGHREMELAFTGLFGRFPEDFYDAYEEAWPLEPGFEARKSLYNLYPVLVHVNLFGHGYTGQAASIIKSYS